MRMPTTDSHHWRDIAAGTAVAGMLLPEAVAYASIAGVPTVHALIAALVGLCVYPLFGSSRFATVAPTSSAAAIFASMVAASGTASGYALVGLTGGLFLLAALFRMEFLAAFVSRPVLRGFSWALALTIIVKQLPHLAGLPAAGGTVFQILAALWRRTGEWQEMSMLWGAAAIALWLGLHRARRHQPWLQPSLLTMAAGIVASHILQPAAAGISLVGRVDLEGLSLQWPQLDERTWQHAAQLSPALLMILFAESWGASRSLALQKGDEISARRELLALGAANLATSLVQGLPVGAGFSASAASFSAGARSKLAGVVAACAIALIVWLLRGELALLPLPVLAAIVVCILLHNVSPQPLLSSLRAGSDAWLALVAIAGVLTTGVLSGMLFAVGLSVALAIKRFSQPIWTELGQLPGTRDYVDIAQHAEAVRRPGMLIVRPEEPVFFANAERIFQEVRDAARRDGIHSLILSMEICDDLDTTSVEALSELRSDLAARNQVLSLARLKDRPRQALLRFDATTNGGRVTHAAENLFWSVDDAVQAMTR